MRRGAVVVAAATLLVAAPAWAKEGARARLLAPVPANARAGSLITVRWTVTLPGPHGTRVPFGAEGMFVTLVGANGVTTSATAKHGGPPYVVRVRVPAGGIHRIRFGLHGVASGPGGTRPAPIFFPHG